MDSNRTEVFLKKVFNIFGDEVIVCSEYLGLNKPLAYLCKKCNKINNIENANTLISNKNRKFSCKNCFWIYKHEKYRKEARDKAVLKISKFENLKIIKEYRDDKENRLFFVLKCNDCKKECTIANYNLRSNWQGCPNCYKKSEKAKLIRKKGLDKSLKNSIEISKVNFFLYMEKVKDFKIISEYINSSVNCTFECNICFEKWSTTPAHIVHSKSKCPYCASGFSFSKKNYKKDVKDIHGSYIKVLEEYKGSNIKILHMCKVCDKPWEAIPASVKKGSGCPNCNLSKGEKVISSVLDKLNIEYLQQWRDHDCKYYKKLPFDFFIKDLNLAIEFQGIQHEKFIKFFHRNEDNFLSQKKRDKIKKEYCKKNNINFLEIFHYDFDNIESIVKNKINSLKNKKTIIK